MKIKNLVKAAEIFIAIKEIDKNILELEKIAIMAADNDVKALVNIKILENEEPTDKGLSTSDHIVDAISTSFHRTFFEKRFSVNNFDEKKPSYKNEFSIGMESIFLLRVCGVILERLTHLRNVKLQELNLYGVNIEI